MYHRIIKQIVRNGFDSLSQGDYKPILTKFAPYAHFSFAGNHAMGADLHDVESIRLWFERMLRIFPGIKFEVADIKVSGMPWNTLVATQLVIHATLPDSRPYTNRALQVVRLQWGRIVEDYVYEDTYVLINVLEKLAQQGVAEATASPIAA
jgi:ketosteroid isomerase-like protein